MLYSFYLSFVLGLVFWGRRILVSTRKFSGQHEEKMALLLLTKEKLEQQLQDRQRRMELAQRSLGNSRSALQFLGEEIVELQNILFQLLTERKSH